jgi:transcriptional regulator with XRE-family HTH domain
MAKLTPFGIALRKLRIDHEMRLFDLAEKLGKSTAMLSAIETGRKPIPDGFVVAVSRAMDLTTDELRALRSAKDKTLKEVRVDHLASDQREMIAVLARSIDDIPAAVLEQLRNSIFKSKDDEVPFRRRRGMHVPPMSNDKLESLAGKVRAIFCRNDDGMIPIIEIIEHRLPKIINSFTFDYRSKEEMGEAEGLVVPGENTLVLRSDVYDAACRGDGRARFTACHEFGHFVMHHEVGLARFRKDSDPIYCDAEWQADRFAGSLMMPRTLSTTVSTPTEAARKFGMSIQAAQFLLKKYREQAS